LAARGVVVVAALVMLGQTPHMESHASCLGAAILACGLSACAGSPASPPGWRIEDLFGPPAEAGVFGDFLAARYAGMTGDRQAAARFYRQAHVRAPDDPATLEQAAFSTLASGDVATAARLAAAADRDVLAGAMFAQLALIVDDLAAGRNRRALIRLESVRLGMMNEDLVRALRAWLVAPDSLDPAVDPDLQPGRRNHAGELAYVRGLILLSAGRDAQALAAFEQGWSSGVRLPYATAVYLRLLAALGDRPKAFVILKGLQAEAGLSPEIEDVAAGLAAGVGFGARFSTRQGMARTIHALSGDARAESGPELAMLHLALALHIDPAFELARLQLAQALREQGRDADAVSELRKIRGPSPYHDHARAEEAWLLQGLGRDAEALQVADGIASAARDRFVRLRVADLYLELERNVDANTLLGAVVEQDAADGRRDWRPLFARAGALRKLGRWQDAEADLVSALEIAPDRPELLNFLGYAWVERGIKIEDGLGLIEQAMANEPDAGYIVDSLGWAHYRLGAYEEAVQILERAAELTPSDPVIADHLGDAYWRIGRVIEAGYAWRNGLTLKPEAPLEASLRTKMASGLSATGATMTADGQAIP